MQAPVLSAEPGAIWKQEHDVLERVVEIAELVEKDYRGVFPLVVTVLEGAAYFSADLRRRLGIPFLEDSIGLSSYDEESGEVRMTKELKHNPLGMDLLIVEDIKHTGRTLRRIGGKYAPVANSVRVAAFVDKVNSHGVGVEVEYVGFEDPEDIWRGGYGLDYKGFFRQGVNAAEMERYRSPRTIFTITEEQKAEVDAFWVHVKEERAGLVGR